MQRSPPGAHGRGQEMGTKFRQPMLSVCPTPAPYVSRKGNLSVVGLLLRHTAGILCHTVGVLCHTVGLVLRHTAGVFCHTVGVLRHALGLLLPGAQETAEPSQGIRREDKAGGDEGLATRNHAVAAAFLVLGAVGVQGVILALARQTEGEECIVQDGSLDRGCVFLDDREGLVDFAQATLGDGVGLGDDRSDESVGFLGVWKDGLDKGFEAGVGEVKRFLSVRIALEGGDGVADDGVRCEVLKGELASTSNCKVSDQPTDKN